MVYLNRALLTLLVSPLLVSGSHEGGQAQECVDTLEDGVDLFPHKVAPITSEWWDVEYHGYYKILTNKQIGESYLLHQCGTSFPADRTESDFAAVVEIPVKEIALTSTPMITYVEQIGARENIKAFLTNITYVSSPCFAENIDQGEVAVFEERSGDDTKVLYGNEPPTQSDLVAFGSQWWSDASAFSKVIKTSESSEKTNSAIFEWALFYSTFFNYEETASEVVQAASDRFECVKTKSAQAVTDTGVKPTLLWAYYSNWGEGWDVAKCPNYYCEFADACSVDILRTTEGNEGSIEKSGYKYMTTEELVAFGKDADFWFFPGPNFDAANDQFGDQLATMKSVEKKQVYDYMGMGKNSWFEQRFAEYYNVLDDMCITVGTRSMESAFKRRHFWRNVETEPVPADGIDAQCTAEAEANILSDPHECGPNTTSGARSGSVFAFAAVIVSMVVTVLATV